MVSFPFSLQMLQKRDRYHLQTHLLAFTYLKQSFDLLDFIFFTTNCMSMHSTYYTYHTCCHAFAWILLLVAFITHRPGKCASTMHYWFLSCLLWVLKEVHTTYSITYLHCSSSFYGVTTFMQQNILVSSYLQKKLTKTCQFVGSALHQMLATCFQSPFFSIPV